jgi:hypothetical protein
MQGLGDKRPKTPYKPQRKQLSALNYEIGSMKKGIFRVFCG